MLAVENVLNKTCKKHWEMQTILHFPVLILHCSLTFEYFLKFLYSFARLSVVFMCCVKSAFSTPVPGSRNKCFQKRFYVKPCKTKAPAVLCMDFKTMLANLYFSGYIIFLSQSIRV